MSTYDYIIILITLLLVYRCNKTEPMLLRIIYTLFALYLREYYIIYYFFFHIVLKEPCKHTFKDTFIISNI